MLRVIVLFFMLLNGHFSMAADVEVAKNDIAAKEYILGSGDLVRIMVYSSPDMTTEVRLSAQGEINFPLIGEVHLGGLSPAQAERKIADLLEQSGFVKNAQVNLVVVQFQSHSISVLGDVYKAGKYALDKPSKLSDVLALAGGPTNNGSDIVTIIRENNGQVTKHAYDLRALLKHADSASNPIINNDDIVFVGGREVSVLGQVGRPGKYSITGGVRTVLDFLSQAGGVAPGGSDTVVVMTKRDGVQLKQEIDVDLMFKTGDTAANIDLADGDSIYVPRAPVFYVYGEVQRSGSFRLERNMTVAQALSVGGGLTGRGTESGMKIKRQIGKELKVIEAHAADELLAGDILYVRESLF